MTERGARALRALGLGALTALIACAHAAPAPPVAAPAPPPAPVETGLEGGASLREATGQGLEFPLPDAAGWRRDPLERHSWVALHPRSSSRLLVRAWRFERIARPEDCEQQGRLWRKELPVFAPAEQIEQREELLANVYRSRLTVGVRAAARQPGRLLGHALAFGSDGRDCLMLVFSTAASGAAASSVIARRLALMEGTVFRHLRRLAIEERVLVPRL